MVPQLHGLPYLQRCKELNLFTLAYRKLRADLIFIYRVIVAKLHPDMAHLLPLAADSCTRGHQYKLIVQRTDNLPHVYRLTRRAVPVWNELPADVVMSSTIAQFKQRMDDVLWQKLAKLPVSNAINTLSRSLERWEVRT